MIINLTPHSVNCVDVVVAGLVGSVRFTPEATPARVSSASSVVGEVGGVPLLRATYGDIEGLPDARPGILLIVSRVVAAAAPHRRDLLVPSDLVRDADGLVTGCRGLEAVNGIQED